MNYQEFKESIVERLKDFYGMDAEVSVNETMKNNKQKMDGVCIRICGEDTTCVPVIYLNHYFEKYEEGVLDMEACIGEIIKIREQSDCCDEIRSFASHLTDWDYIKESVYPMLISTAKNRELMEELVNSCFLDLSVIYVIRGAETGEGASSVKVTETLFSHFGITKEELHVQAVKNMEKDGYEFQDVENIVAKLLTIEETSLEDDITSVKELEPGKMYVLTNAKKMYGAAGILNQDFLMERLGNTSCFVLPSSMHELIFVPVTEEIRQTELDEMVKEINETQVEAGEVLSNHSYYYDAILQEVRICA